MKIEYDERADLLYLRLDPRTQDVLNRRVSDDVVLDMGEGQMIVGIEIMHASRNLDLSRDGSWHAIVPRLYRQPRLGSSAGSAGSQLSRIHTKGY